MQLMMAIRISMMVPLIDPVRILLINQSKVAHNMP